MSLKPTYTCDLPGCEVVKQESNHWWLVWEGDNFFIKTWDNSAASDPHVKHFCGQGHLQSFIEQWCFEKTIKLNREYEL